MWFKSDKIGGRRVVSSEDKSKCHKGSWEREREKGEVWKSGKSGGDGDEGMRRWDEK